MKSSAALSLLFLLPGIRAAALPQLVGSELESTSSSLKRDASGNLAPRSPQPGSSELEDDGSNSGILPEAAASMTDDPSLDPSANRNRDLSARSPQGPASNPGEFTDVGLSRVNPANHHSSADSSSSSSTNEGQELYTITAGSKGFDPDLISKMSHDRHRGWDAMMGDDAKMEHHRHHNWNGRHDGHRKDGILEEFNAHGEHIVVYNGTHYPNGTSYSPANETTAGGKMLEKVVVNGDEVVVYRQPWNGTHHHHNFTGGPAPTATGVWLPSGTGWIPSETGRPRHHRKMPSAAYAGFRGPMSKRDRKIQHSSKRHRGPSIRAFFFLLVLFSPTVAASATPVAHPVIESTSQNDDVVRKQSVPVGTPTQLPKRPSDVAMSWTQAVQSGEALLRQMTDGGPQSEFRSYADLAENGWSCFPTDGATDTDLESALRGLGATSGTYVNMMQQDDFKLPGSDTEYPATYAQYQQYYNTVQGLIIAEFNYGPQRTYKGPGAVYPALNRWSDVVYLVWADLCNDVPDAIKKINYFIRHHIRIDSPTVTVINEATGGAGNLNPWPGLRFSTETERGRALLDTAHGYGVAWFLINHQDVLSRKVIEAVTVFRTADAMMGGFYNMLLEVGPA